jgi:hypothetical protein
VLVAGVGFDGALFLDNGLSLLGFDGVLFLKSGLSLLAGVGLDGVLFPDCGLSLLHVPSWLLVKIFLITCDAVVGCAAGWLREYVLTLDDS